MIRDELLRLIAHGEGPRLEFKRSLAELDDTVRTITTFANAEGGTLLFYGATLTWLDCSTG